jgi:carbonic anhydrase/acetyltransferase-like protein (isoleucine patch superfamily)
MRLPEEDGMSMAISHEGVRPNPSGDWPEIDHTAFVDPSVQVIGNVWIGHRVYVGPNAVIRADEADLTGQVRPVVIEAQCNVQDGAIIHAMGGTSVTVGPGTCMAHGCMVHGPCVIGEGCFLGFRCVVFRATIEDAVWVGIGAIVLGVSIPYLRAEFDVGNPCPVLSMPKEIEFWSELERMSR